VLLRSCEKLSDSRSEGFALNGIPRSEKMLANKESENIDKMRI
jgi:hypothetical protein